MSFNLKKMSFMLQICVLSIAFTTNAEAGFNIPKIGNIVTTLNHKSAPVSSNGQYGSAKHLKGKTLFVSIFADNPLYKWTNSAQDTNDKYLILDKVRIAANYLEKECSKYGSDATFIYDWTQNEDLVYSGFCNSTAKEYAPKAELVKKLVDEKALKSKYGAENVLYLYFINTDASYTGTNFCHRYTPDYKNDSMAEIAVFSKIRSYKKGPCFLLTSSVAHEILHAYGAPDLYVVNKQINQSYVNYLKSNNIKDIMGNNNYGDTITSPIGQTTAYYLGLVNSAPDVARFNLGPAEK